MTGLVWLLLLFIMIVCMGTEMRYDRFGWLAMISGILLFIMLIVWPVAWYEDKTFKAEYEMTKKTVELMRESDRPDLETAALIHKLVATNEAIGKKRYWNDGIFDWYIPDDVADLEPLY